MSRSEPRMAVSLGASLISWPGRFGRSEALMAGARFCRGCGVLLFLGILLAGNRSLGGDSAALISLSITNGTQVTPRSVYTETWTFTNNGTTTWAATRSGYTLNLISLDSLGLMQRFTNFGSTYHVSAIIGSNKSVAPGQTGSFSIDFIAPEAAGTYTDTFQLNNSSSAFFGPTVTVQVVVAKAWNTNVYDRCRAISFANNYVTNFCPDGYFWTNQNYGQWAIVTPDSLAPVPTWVIGDDCAHFVSYCIGNGPYVRGGGMNVPSRTSPTYGEPSAGDMINNILLKPGFGVEVSSLSQLEPGDVIGWNWEGNPSISNIDHVTLYMGNGLTSCHAASILDVDPTYFGTGWVWHLIHILDYPTLWSSRSSNKMTFTWTTNWSGYALYSNSTINGAWTKVTNKPTVTGITNKLTLTMPAKGSVFYRLEMP